MTLTAIETNAAAWTQMCKSLIDDDQNVRKLADDPLAQPIPFELEDDRATPTQDQREHLSTVAAKRNLGITWVEERRAVIYRLADQVPIRVRMVGPVGCDWIVTDRQTGEVRLCGQPSVSSLSESKDESKDDRFSLCAEHDALTRRYTPANEEALRLQMLMRGMGNARASESLA